MPSVFYHLVIKSVLRNVHTYHTGNWDYFRFGPDPAPFPVPGQTYQHVDAAAHFLIDFLMHHADYEWVYHAFQDDASRSLLIDLLTYRVLGPVHVKLPLNTTQFWHEYQTINARYLRKEKLAKSVINSNLSFDLNQYAFPFQGHELVLLVDPLSILMYIVGQYYYDRDGVRVRPEPGDVVIDGGGCWGEAALAFGCSVGPSGKVYSFEFVPENLDIFRKNLEACRTVSRSVEIVERALGEQSGVKIPYRTAGPGSRLIAEQSDRVAQTASIDDFVAAKGLRKVDYIKMDIEGSEMAALRGARATIQRHKPKLAISVYHALHDYYEIPRLIREIEPTYQFYLDHHTIYLEETVLYARAA
jgi:FkbM family methyltransferase